MRKRPAVNRELPPASSSCARSRTRTLFTPSEAESAAQSAALPPPTTMTSHACNRAPSGFAVAPRQASETLARRVDIVVEMIKGGDDDPTFFRGPFLPPSAGRVDFRGGKGNHGTIDRSRLATS